MVLAGGAPSTLELGPDDNRSEGSGSSRSGGLFQSPTMSVESSPSEGGNPALLPALVPAWDPDAGPTGSWGNSGPLRLRISASTRARACAWEIRSVPTAANPVRTDWASISPRSSQKAVHPPWSSSIQTSQLPPIASGATSLNGGRRSDQSPIFHKRRQLFFMRSF